MGFQRQTILYRRQSCSLQLKKERKLENKKKVGPVVDCYVPDKNQEWDVYVQTLCGRVIAVIVNPYDTIEKVRYKVGMKEGISHDQIMLLKNGKLLEDGDTLEYWNIRDKSLIYMSLRLRGG